MTIEEIIGFAGGLDGVLTTRPAPGDGSPEIAWGDVFFTYAPDGAVAAGAAAQPFATIVTKDYPGDTSSRLSRPGAFRVNIAAGRAAFTRATGHAPRATPPPPATSPDDTLLPHPLYGTAAWLSITNPSPRTSPALRALLTEAHARARARNAGRTRPAD